MRRWPLPALPSPRRVLDVSNNGTPTGPFYANFDNLALGNAGGQINNDINVSFTGDADTVNGFLGGIYAAPFVNGNGGLFGDAENRFRHYKLSQHRIGSVTLTFTKGADLSRPVVGLCRSLQPCLAL